MKRILGVIEREQVEFLKNPLFAWTRGLDGADTPEEAAKRLTKLAGEFSHWVMGFRDLMKFRMTYRPEEFSSNDITRHQQVAINVHAAEDETHWLLFLEDLVTLKANQKFDGDITKMLKYYHSDENDDLRRHTYLVTELIHASPILRYPLIEAMEMAGRAFFQSSVVAAKTSGLNLRYFGDHHLALETGHLMNQEDGRGEDLFVQLSLEPDQLNIATAIVERFYEMISGFCSGVYKRVIVVDK